MTRTTDDALRICVRSLQRAAEAIRAAATKVGQRHCACGGKLVLQGERTCELCGKDRDEERVEYSPDDLRLLDTVDALYDAAERLVYRAGYRRPIASMVRSPMAFAYPTKPTKDDLTATISKAYYKLRDDTGHSLLQSKYRGLTLGRQADPSDNGLGRYHGKC